MSKNGPADEADISAQDLADLSKVVGNHFSIVHPQVGCNETALHGDYQMLRLHSGLSVHTSDATALRDMTTIIEQQPGMTIMVFLAGTVDAAIGGLPLDVGRSGVEPVQGVMVSRARPDKFVRHTRKGDRVRKVNVTVTPKWLNECVFENREEGDALLQFQDTHLSRFSWTASANLVSLAEQMLNPPVRHGLMHNLYLESRALDLVAEAFGAYAHASGQDEGHGLRPYDQRRLRQIEDYLDEHGHEAPTLAEIARNGGVSVSTLRRLFRAAHGTTVFDYLRNRGLQRARQALERDGVTVGQAAAIAGYGSAANFSTAFKRVFGMTPREARRH